MQCQTSVIVTAFQRPRLLELGLTSLTQQNIPFEYEIIVINDGLPDETEAVCEAFQDRLNLKYLFTGQRNCAGELKWRVPGYAVNIGARQAKGEVMMITCAEMFHLNNTIAKLTGPLLKNRFWLTIPSGFDDREGGFLKQLVEPETAKCEPQVLLQLPPLNTRLPFLLGVYREHFMAIGGYDEDFTGIAFDDDDLVGRLRAYGCEFRQTDALTVHLYHPRYVYQVGMSPEWHFNRKLYLARQNQIVRNQNRNWGELPDVAAQ